MLSHLEMRHVMEVAFRPLMCKCTITPDGFMTVELKAPDTELEVLTLTGISTVKLRGGRAIAALVGEIKDQVKRAQDGLKMRG